MIEVKNHSKYHAFRAYNFQNFPGGGMHPDPPRLSCYATVVYFCHSQPGADRAKSSITSLVPL